MPAILERLDQIWCMEEPAISVRVPLSGTLHQTGAAIVGFVAYHLQAWCEVWSGWQDMLEGCRAGTYVLLFDNTYSMMTGKTLR
jgi:hypothetical protein